MTIDVPSPCISICAIDEATGLCKGCFRTGKEVADWPYLNNADKAGLLTELEKRGRARRA